MGLDTQPVEASVNMALTVVDPDVRALNTPDEEIEATVVLLLLHAIPAVVPPIELVACDPVHTENPLLDETAVLLMLPAGKALTVT